MTECHHQTIDFSRLGPKAVVADLQGGRLTTDAGALLLRELGDRLGLFDALDAAIPDPRHPLFIVHEQRPMLAQRIIAIASGSEDLNDHQALRVDPTLQVAAGRAPDPELPLASPPHPLSPREPRRPQGPGQDRRGAGRSIHRRPSPATRALDPRL